MTERGEFTGGSKEIDKAIITRTGKRENMKQAAFERRCKGVAKIRESDSRTTKM